MAKAFSRPERVADFLRRELASLIQLKLRDPRLGMISITDVEVSKDVAHARVFVTVLGKEDKTAAQDSMVILNKASGFLRNEIAKIATMRNVPSLSFKFDESLQRGLYMSALIDKALDADKQHHPDGDDETT